MDFKILFSSVVLSLAFLSGCSSTDHKKTASTNDSVDLYVQKARNIIESTKANLPADQISNKAHELIALSVPIIKQFGSDNPDCKKYLDMVISLSEVMPTLNLREINTQFREGEVLPNSPEKCGKAKELVVNPATVVILAEGHYDDEGREKIAGEMAEAIERVEDLE